MVTQDKIELTPYEHLKHCLAKEMISGTREFTWGRALRNYWRKPHLRYQFKWRVASYLHSTGSKRKIKLAQWLNRRISRQHNVDIQLGAKIGAGLRISHHSSIIISHLSTIGENLHIYQNTTIGAKVDKTGFIHIGDNVTICAHCCIIGLDLTIGDNVTIGAATFVNKDIPSGVICYSKREYNISEVPAPHSAPSSSTHNLNAHDDKALT